MQLILNSTWPHVITYTNQGDFLVQIKRTSHLQTQLSLYMNMEIFWLLYSSRLSLLVPIKTLVDAVLYVIYIDVSKAATYCYL